MRKGRNPWISISDLLSSVVLVLVLLFIMAAIGPKYSQETQRREMMGQIETSLIDYEQKGLLKVHQDTGMVEFTSITFKSGSAELSNETIALAKVLSSMLTEYMEEHENMEILIEGHTDPAAVGSVRNSGGYFADNIQLSTLRASNVRSVLLDNMGQQYATRIGVAGYGDTRLRNKENPLSPENRRIEIRILWNGKKDN